MTYLAVYLALGALCGALDIWLVQSRWRAADRWSDYVWIGSVWLIIWPLPMVMRCLRPGLGNTCWED